MQLKQVIMAFSSEIRVVEDNIISLLKNKDQRGMELLYDKYGNIIYGFLYNSLQSDVIAEEAFNDVFIRVWRGIHAFDPKTMRLFTWVINFARQAAKSKSKNQPVNKSANPSVTSLNVSEHYNPGSAGVRDMVRQMDKKQRKMMEEIYFEGKNIKELSAMSDIPQSNLKSMVRSVVKMLQINPLPEDK
ncbi:MAG: RNA polymerase sigma factor [Bacteroidia bacterium]